MTTMMTTTMMTTTTINAANTITTTTNTITTTTTDDDDYDINENGGWVESFACRRPMINSSTARPSLYHSSLSQEYLQITIEYDSPITKVTWLKT